MNDRLLEMRISTRKTKEITATKPILPPRPYGDICDFEIYGLYAAHDALGRVYPHTERYVRMAREFTLSLTPALNGENGQALWIRMMDHVAAKIDSRRRARWANSDAFPADRAYDEFYTETLFLFNRREDRVIGTISSVTDDLNRGKLYGIDGSWISGLNILTEFHNKRLGTILFKTLLCNLKFHRKAVAGHPVRINLFTKSPYVEKMAIAAGFVKNHDLVMRPEDAGNIHLFLMEI